MKISLVGCGKIAHFHMQVLRHLGVEIVSVCGRENSENAKLFAEQYAIPRVYSSWKELLLNDKPDAFWVVSDWKEAHEMLVPFIKKGIPCFFEKPVALTSKKIKEAISAKNKYKTKVLVGYNRRFYEFTDEAKNFINTHKVLAAQINIPEVIEKYVQQKDFEKIKNLWIYNSSHVLDLLYYLIGDIKIRLLCKKNDEDIGLPVSFNGMLYSSKHDFPIHMAANWGTPGNFEITFYAKGYALKISPLEIMRLYSGMQVNDPKPGCSVRIFNPILVKEVCVDAKYKPGFLRQAQNFIDTCVSGKYDNICGATLEDALKVTLLCEKIQNG